MYKEIILNRYLTAPSGVVYLPQLVQLTYGYRKRNQKKIRRLRRQGVKGV